MASSRGKAIRGAGALLKRNVSLGVDVGPPHRGEEGDVRVNMVNNQPRLYAMAGNQWYNTPLYKAPIAALFEQSSGTGTKLKLDAESSLILQANRIICSGGVGRFEGKSLADRSIAIGDKSVMGSINSTVYHLDNVAIGNEALANGTEMRFNVAIGNTAMRYMGQHASDTYLDCYRNVAIGLGALAGNPSGRPQAQENVAIGYAAMNYADTISDAANMTCKWNVAMGALAGYGIEGQYNTCIGSGSGFPTVLRSGNNNTLLGASTRTSATDSDDQIVIGYNAVGIADNTTVIGNSSNVKTILTAGTLSMKEQADDAVDIAGNSQIWVKNTGAGILMFTADDGTQYTVDVTAV